MFLHSSLSAFSPEFDFPQAIDLMCYFVSLRLKGYDSLTLQTRTALQHRVDPNQDEVEKSSVEVLLYTPGSKFYFY